MAQSSGQSSGSGSDLHLPDEILKVIPIDPYDQLDLARKITSMAIASRVSKMDTEMTRMRQTLYEKDKIIFELEEKVMGLDVAHQDAESRLKHALEENARLLKERDQLAMTAKKLSRDLAKLETFKRQLMQSLSDDNSSPTETVDIGTCEQPVPKSYANKDNRVDRYAAYHSYNGSNDVGNSKADEASRLAGQKFSLTPYITPRLTPTGTPSLTSTAGSPRAYSVIPTPQKSSGAASPTNLPYDGRGSYSSWFPSSQQSSAASSPPRTRSQTVRPPRIDGKEFFRQARSRLSYEQFSAFLANIKELNAQKQTREETLRKAEEIFGTDNKDLYVSFQGLLSRSTQ